MRLAFLLNLRLWVLTEDMINGPMGLPFPLRWWPILELGRHLLRFLVTDRHYFVCCASRIQLEKGKVAKYLILNDRLRSQLVDLETSGGFGPSSMMYHEYVGSKITQKTVTEDKQSTCFSVFIWLLCGSTHTQL